MEITIRLRNTLNGQEKEVALPTSLESIEARFGLDETNGYDNLVIVDSDVEFIGENDSLEVVLDFSKFVRDVDEHLVYACHEFFGYDVREFLFNLYGFEYITLLPDVNTNRELGEYWVNEIGIQNIPRDQLEMYFDYEAYGRDISIENTGGFVADGFLDVR
ncbi:antirestriction protein ArdA [Streptococcus gallolyticus]|uniref:Antirestriction protein (ArdA) n=1 Tax=Streptococcus gallolyticus TaxID=315405 RepID=A0A1H9PCL4_9STRE|nr:antirestriction protein ArdA [Streptococcus gallolyticus]SER45313.1 Antirestriction protein (ArdA) [Streptococcus gallolyticus]